MYVIVYPITYKLSRWEIHCGKGRALLRCGTPRTMTPADPEAHSLGRQFARPFNERN
jgi:hypothetical protein